MTWLVTYVPEFEAWLRGQTDRFREELMAHVLALQDQGPQLGRPYCDTVSGSRWPNMKELRIQHHGDPYRVLFAFDLRRRAVLLLGGNKRGDDRWYTRNVPLADDRFGDWQESIRSSVERSRRAARRRRRRKGR